VNLFGHDAAWQNARTCPFQQRYLTDYQAGKKYFKQEGKKE
jgi:hypothetical protein